MDRDTLGRWLVVGVTAALLVFSVSLGVATAQSAAPIISSSPASDAAKYWTPEKMKAAIPADEVLRGGPTVPAVVPQSTGTPGVAGGSKPGQSWSQGLKVVPQSLLDESIRELALPISEPLIPADGPYPGRPPTQRNSDKCGCRDRHRQSRFRLELPARSTLDTPGLSARISIYRWEDHRNRCRASL
jgi:hypothetical protein